MHNATDFSPTCPLKIGFTFLIVVEIAIEFLMQKEHEFYQDSVPKFVIFLIVIGCLCDNVLVLYGEIIRCMIKQYLTYCCVFLPQIGYAQKNIIAAIDEIQRKSCIRFRMKKRGDRHWIRFVKKIG